MPGNAIGHLLWSEPKSFKTLLWCGVINKAIRNPKPVEGDQNSTVVERFQYGSTKTACQCPLLHGDDTTNPLRQWMDELLIQRAKEACIDDGGLSSSRCQKICRRHCPAHH